MLGTALYRGAVTRDQPLAVALELASAKRGVYLATPSGFEPPISTVTGWRVGPLHYGAA